MRGSKWELIKPLLKTLQEFFPAEICVALIIKPDNFWQKQKTNFGSAKFSFEVSGPVFFFLGLSVEDHLTRKHQNIRIESVCFCTDIMNR